MAQLRLCFLPSFHVTLDDRPVAVFRSAKTQALLAYLATEADRPHSRAALAGLLWPDQPDRSAHHNLSQAIFNLRQTLGDRAADQPFLLIGRHTIQFNRACEHWMDVADVDAYIARCQNHPHLATETCATCTQDLRKALAAYQGPFLAEFASIASDLFDEWVLLKREWLHQRIQAALAQLVAYYERQADYSQAQHYARYQVLLDPLREATHQELMRVLAFGGQRGAALEQYHACRRLLIAELGVEPAAQTTALYQRILDGELENAALVARAYQRWGDTPDMGSFYGRQAELATLERWIGAEHCRVVAVLGMGGTGKTALVARLVETIADRFDAVLWYSLANAPSMADMLLSCCQAIAPQRAPPASLDTRLALLIEELRRQRCLLVLDSFESMFQSGRWAGSYRSGYDDYGQLIERVSRSRHQSCIVLISREQPVELVGLEGSLAPVQVMRLSGLAEDDGRSLLLAAGVADSPDALVRRYSGNPLALKLVAESIRDQFAGNSSEFLREETAIFDELRDVLDQHWRRLEPLEEELLTWMAIEREPVSVTKLCANLIGRASCAVVLEAARSLWRHSLLERRGDHFSLPEILLAHATARLIAQVGAGLATERLELLIRYALIQNQAQEHIRERQARLILAPIAHQLALRLGTAHVYALLQQLLARLGAEPGGPGYAASNILALLLVANREAANRSNDRIDGC